MWPIFSAVGAEVYNTGFFLLRNTVLPVYMTRACFHTKLTPCHRSSSLQFNFTNLFWLFFLKEQTNDVFAYDLYLPANI